jgi:hypothetical protein
MNILNTRTISSPISSPFGIAGSRFNPLNWFAKGEQGAWYDPSDLTTLFQDSTGTTPVTAVEQPVGLMRDKSGRGNHAFQATAGNRPVLSARVNLLIYTEAIATGWVYIGGTETTNNLSPTGITNAYAVTSSSGRVGRYSQTITFIGYTTYIISSYVKLISGSAGEVWVGNTNNIWGASTTNIVRFNLITLAFNAISAGSTSQGFEPAGNGWYRVWTIGTTIASPGSASLIAYNNTTGATIGIWGTDLRPTNAGALLPPYQRVNTASDYDTVGFPLYLKCNGTSSAMSTNSIDFTSTDKMTVVTGVRKLSDANTFPVIFEVGPTPPRSLSLYQNLAANGDKYTVSIYGTVDSWGAGGPTLQSPATSVISIKGDISAATRALAIDERINGISYPLSGGSDISPAGTNFKNLPLYLFARAGTSLFFNGQFYGAIIRGAQSDTASVTQTENYMAQKTGITF